MNWQIAFFSIVRYEPGVVFRDCRDGTVQFDLPNRVFATGTDSFGPQTVSADATVMIGEAVVADIDRDQRLQHLRHRDQPRS